MVTLSRGYRATARPSKLLLLARSVSIMVVFVPDSSRSSVPHRPVPPPPALAPLELVADRLAQPVGVAVDATGSIFVSEHDAGRITRLAQDGARTTMATGFDQPMGLAVDAQGRLLIVEQARGRLWRLEPAGPRTLLATGIRDPRWIAVAQDGRKAFAACAGKPTRRSSGSRRPTRAPLFSSSSSPRPPS